MTIMMLRHPVSMSDPRFLAGFGCMEHTSPVLLRWGSPLD